MRLFKADFYRNFAIGFALGTVVVFAALGESNESMVVPSAIAAPAADE